MPQNQLQSAAAHSLCAPALAHSDRILRHGQTGFVARPLARPASRRRNQVASVCAVMKGGLGSVTAIQRSQERAGSDPTHRRGRDSPTSAPPPRPSPAHQRCHRPTVLRPTSQLRRLWGCQGGVAGSMGGRHLDFNPRQRPDPASLLLLLLVHARPPTPFACLFGSHLTRGSQVN